MRIKMTGNQVTGVSITVSRQKIAQAVSRRKNKTSKGIDSLVSQGEGGLTLSRWELRKQIIRLSDVLAINPVLINRK